MTAPGLKDFLGRISAGRDGVPISIDEAQEISGLNRAAVLERFRRLQTEGEGYLRLGRHGHPTRFYFRSSSGAKPSLDPPGAVRSGDPVERIAGSDTVATSLPEGASAASEAQDFVEHRYRLRADLQITINLPSDLSEREALRIARFVETLPL